MMRSFTCPVTLSPRMLCFAVLQSIPLPQTGLSVHQAADSVVWRVPGGQAPAGDFGRHPVEVDAGGGVAQRGDGEGRGKGDGSQPAGPTGWWGWWGRRTVFIQQLESAGAVQRDGKRILPREVALGEAHLGESLRTPAGRGEGFHNLKIY